MGPCRFLAVVLLQLGTTCDWISVCGRPSTTPPAALGRGAGPLICDNCIHDIKSPPCTFSGCCQVLILGHSGKIGRVANYPGWTLAVALTSSDLPPSYPPLRDSLVKCRAC